MAKALQLQRIEVIKIENIKIVFVAFYYSIETLARVFERSITAITARLQESTRTTNRSFVRPLVGHSSVVVHGTRTR